MKSNTSQFSENETVFDRTSESIVTIIQIDYDEESDDIDCIYVQRHKDNKRYYRSNAALRKLALLESAKELIFEKVLGFRPDFNIFHKFDSIKLNPKIKKFVRRSVKLTFLLALAYIDVEEAIQEIIDEYDS